MSVAGALFEGVRDCEILARYEIELAASEAAGNLAEDTKPVRPLPTAVRVQDLPEEATIQERFARGLGSIAIGAAEEWPPSAEGSGRITSILDAIDEAARGNSASLEMNVALASDEALSDEGKMGSLTITRGPNGQWQQEGQSLYDVLKNAITLYPGDEPGLHEITHATGLDLYALDELNKAGYFEAGYMWIIPRMAPTGTSGRAIRTYGYFKNIAVAWNIIRKTGPDTFTLTPMFTAGALAPLSEEVQNRKMTPAELDALYEIRLARRHDITAVGGMYAELGLPVPATIPGFLRGFLLHVSQLEDPDHPEVYVGSHYDTQLGPDFFQGRERTPEDVGYIENGERHMEALAGLHRQRKATVRELIRLRSTFPSEMAATQCMARLVARRASDYVYDNPQYHQLFGPSLGAAAYIGMLNGDSKEEVRSKAVVNMCGHGGISAEDGGNSDKSSTDGAGEGETAADSSDSGECEYRGTFCYCCPYNNDGSDRGTPMVVAIRRKDGVARCQRPGCGAWLSADGTNKGKIFEKAKAIRRLKRAVNFVPVSEASPN